MVTLTELFATVAGDSRSPALPDFYRDSPFCPHLWRLAQAVTHCRAPDSTPAAVGLQQYLATNRTDATAKALSSNTAAVSEAIEVVVGHELRRVELEARVLADQDRDEIALRLQVGPEVIRVYEMFVFEVRPRLRASSWIRHMILKPDPWFVLKRTDVPLHWRWFAYRYEPLVVDLLTRSVTRAQLARQGVDAYLDSDVPIPDGLKILTAIERIPIPGTVEEMVRLEALRSQLNAVVAERATNAGLGGPIGWQGGGDQPLAAEVRTIERAREILNQVA